MIASLEEWCSRHGYTLDIREAADLRPGQVADPAAETHGTGAFLADRLALARGEVGEEALEIRVAAVFPVELLGDAVEEPHRGSGLGLLFGAEGDMGRGQAVVRCDLHKCLRECGAA